MLNTILEVTVAFLATFGMLAYMFLIFIGVFAGGIFSVLIIEKTCQTMYKIWQKFRKRII